MADTAISWTHRPGTRGRTWNPARGCRRKSAGCEHCYAEAQAARIVRMGKGKPTPYDGLVRVVGGEPRWTGEIALDADRLAEPLRWRDPSTVFVDSMSDLFYDRRPDEHIAAVFGVMAATPQHTYLILTKYAARMRAWFEWVRGPSENTFTMQQRGIASAPNTFRALLDAAYEVLGKPSKPALDAAWHTKLAESDPWPLPNVWIGVSVENQAAAEERINDLLATPAAVRFLSCEPLLDHADLGGHLGRLATCGDCTSGEQPSGGATGDCEICADRPATVTLPGVDWVIAGCESGPNARPCDVAWLRSLRDQCAAAGVPFFLKQGIATLGGDVADQHANHLGLCSGQGSRRKPGGVIELPYLDGVQHAAFPEASR